MKHPWVVMLLHVCKAIIWVIPLAHFLLFPTSDLMDGPISCVIVQISKFCRKSNSPIKEIALPDFRKSGKRSIKRLYCTAGVTANRITKPFGRPHPVRSADSFVPFHLASHHASRSVPFHSTAMKNSAQR